MAHLGFAPRSDWRYLVRHARNAGVGDDERSPAERDAGNYYMRSVEGGEPPGRWFGPGVAALGLEAGSEVSPEQMKAVYGKLRHPETGEQLGSKPRKYADHDERLKRLLDAEPDAGPERRAELEFQARKNQREACHYYDLTYSPEKSWSVLYAGLMQAGRDAEAAALWDCVEEGYQAGLEHAMGQACYARTGRHAGNVAGRTSGRWEKASEWMATSWRHHTSRDGDPQLHIHGAILNRVRTADGRWFALDGTAVKHVRREAAAVGSRVAESLASQRLGLRFYARADGLGREIEGVDPDLLTQFSSRRRAIEPEAQRLADAYLERYGREPKAWELRLFAQQATLATRARKPEHPDSEAQRLAGWEAQVRDGLGASLAEVPDQAGVALSEGERRPGVEGLSVRAQDAQPAHDAQADTHAGTQVAQVGAQGTQPDAQLTQAERRRVITQALAEVEGKRSVWRRTDLTAALDTHLPTRTLTLPPEQQTALLASLADEAVAGEQAVKLAAEPLVTPPESWRDEDGRGWHEPANVYHRYSTRRVLGREQRLVEAATATGAPTADSAQVVGRLDAAGLRADQRAVLEQITSSGRRVDVLVGPAGAGKSHTLGELGRLWPATVPTGEDQQGAPRVLGLAPSQQAAHVLNDAGLDRHMNIAEFMQARDDLSLGRRVSPRRRELASVRRGDLLVVDEASMASTSQLTSVVEIAEKAGAKVLVTGDDRQLQAVEQGGGFALLTERCQPARLREVVRFSNEWEAEASLRLRDRDPSAVREYDRHGRIRSGSTEDMVQQARQFFLADYLTGRDTLVVTATTEQAADVASRIRADLVAEGHVEDAGVSLQDATRAGVGDLIQTRQNNSRVPDGAGGWVTNRDIWQVETRHDDGALTVRRQLDRDTEGGHRWAEPVTLPPDYVREQVSLAYAATVHAKQGATVDTSYTLVDPQMPAEALYPATTRGRDRNLLLVPLDTGETPALGPQDTRDKEQPTAEGILTGILERDPEPESALQVLDQEIDARESLARLAPEWHDLITRDTEQRYRGQLERLLTEQQWNRLDEDPALGPLLRTVRAAEANGRDTDQLLTQAVTGRELDSASSIGQVLHHRVTADTPPEHLTAEGSYVARTPQLSDPQLEDYAQKLAHAMDTRLGVLGDRAAADPPAWAEPLGPVPDDPLERAEWTRRAGLIAGYREEHGQHHEQDALGPAPHAEAAAARQGWLAAWDALGRPDEHRDTAMAGDGDLLNVLDTWQRAQHDAPAHVDEQLRDTAQQVADADRDTRHVTRLLDMRHNAGTDTAATQERLDDAHQAEHDARAQLAVLEDQAQRRQHWYEETQAQRRAAQLARDELTRRGDHDLQAFTTVDDPQDSEPQPEPAQEVVPGREGGDEVAAQEPQAQRKHAREQEEPAPERELDWDSQERRDRMRAHLESLGIDESAMDARTLAAQSQARPVEEALRRKQAQVDSDQDDEAEHEERMRRDEADRDHGIER